MIFRSGLEKRRIFISIIILVLLLAFVTFGIKFLIPRDILYVSFGDSLAHGYPYYMDNKSYSYTDFIYQHLETQHEVNVKVNYINYGTSGYTSTDLINQINKEDVALNISNADVITINIGGNDMLKAINKYGVKNYQSILDSIDVYSDNLVKILSRFRELNPNAKIYISSLFNPLLSGTGDVDFERSDQIIVYINKIIYNVAKPYNVRYIDVSMLFKGHEYGTPDSWFHDKIHPNKKGYLEMSKPFASVILNDLKPKSTKD